jgi:glycosyltransferase involved in cell wall biosynthesis
MRVGLVVTGGVDRSGRERVIPALLWLIERLARHFDLHVFLLHQELRPSTYPLLGATIHDLGRVNALPGLGRRTHLKRVIAALASVGRLDLLHAYWAVPAGIVTTIAAGRLHVPSIVTADSGEWAAIPDIRYGLQRRWADRRAVARAMRRATRVTVCSEQMARLAAGHGVDATVIPLGVPPELFPPTTRLEGPPWRLLHVASINRVKDHATLFQAMARLVREEPRVHLDVIGADTLGGQAEQLVRSLGLGSHVQFHGFLPTGQVAAFLARAHLHLVTSRHEAAGVVTLEAAAAGVPTVGTAVGYVADGAGTRAIAVPVRDPGALSAAILTLLRDPDRRASLAAAARDWAVAHDADWTAAEFARLYKALVARQDSAEV